MKNFQEIYDRLTPDSKDRLKTFADTEGLSLEDALEKKLGAALSAEELEALSGAGAKRPLNI